jgi:CHAT domain-containing protein
VLVLCGALGIATADEASIDDLLAAGTQSFAAGQFAAAVQRWDEALTRLDALRQPALVSDLLMRLSVAQISLGHYPRALEASRQAVALAVPLGDPELEARVRANLGGAYLASGQLAIAEEALTAAIAGARAAGLSQVAAAAGNNLGNVMAARKELARAVQTYDAAAVDAATAGDALLAAQALVNSARALRAGERFEQVAARLERALEQVWSLAPTHDKAYALVSIGRLYVASRARIADADAHAARALGEAAATAEQVGDARALSYALGYLGELEERAGRYEEALDLSRRAVRAAQQVSAAESLYRWQWQTGRVLKAMNDLPGATRAYRRAVATLQGIRVDLSSGYMGARASFRERVGPVYLELADLLLRGSHGSVTPERRDALLKDARAAVELLKGAELSDYFEDDCVAEFKARSAGIERLAPRTAAVYPIILEDRLEILLSTAESLELYTVPVGAQALTAEVRALRRNLERRFVHGYMPHARQVYEWLVRPLEGGLERHGVETIVFVPDGPLRTVPMASLHDGEDFLVARYAVATTPGLTLTDPRPIPRDDIELLLGGLTEPVQGFAPLPAVDEELATIADLFPSKVLKDEAFVLSSVESELSSTAYSIVHVASHGQFDADLSETFLLTYDGRLDMDQIGELMGITSFRPRPVELLTLSACQTAAGDDRAALGLAGVAVKSGARSAIATLWFVNDRASSVLVSEFYRNLQDRQLSKAQALQRAQLAVQRMPQYRHPAYWSAYLLIGNWL